MYYTVYSNIFMYMYNIACSNFSSTIILLLLCIGMKHREERVVGGEVKPIASVFGEEEEEDPQVLYDKVSS